ncbi:MAG: hypothetical protein K2P63_14705, partial [Lachnospiraceae bacterium]|nr:hypothetical protein [Lachnospiraceae bacterium]
RRADLITVYFILFSRLFPDFYFVRLAELSPSGARIRFLRSFVAWTIWRKNISKYASVCYNKNIAAVFQALSVKSHLRMQETVLKERQSSCQTCENRSFPIIFGKIQIGNQRPAEQITESSVFQDSALGRTFPCLRAKKERYCAAI